MTYFTLQGFQRDSHGVTLDNTKLSGYCVTATVEGEEAAELIHSLGKELK